MLHESTLAGSAEPDNEESITVWCTSKDGTVHETTANLLEQEEISDSDGIAGHRFPTNTIRIRVVSSDVV